MVKGGGGGLTPLGRLMRNLDVQRCSKNVQFDLIILLILLVSLNSFSVYTPWCFRVWG